MLLLELVIIASVVVLVVQARAFLHFEATSRSSTQFKYRGVVLVSGTQLIEGLSADVNEDVVFAYRNGNSYMYSAIESKCEVAEVDIPFIDFYKHALANANLVWDSNQNTTTAQILDSQVGACAKQKQNIWHLAVDDNEFVICGSVVNNTIVPSKIISPEFVADVTTQPKKSIDLNIQFSRLDAKCGKPKNHAPRKLDAVVPMNQAIQKPWFHRYSKSCRHSFRRGEECERLDRTRTRNNVEKELKDCVFVHGTGAVGNGTVIMSDKGYWGHVEKYTPQCKNRYFMYSDTVGNGWDNERLHREVCTAVLHNTNQADKIVRNRIIFAHSMGNLILAGAIKRGLCDIDPATTSWYALMAPWHGSKAANFVEKLCPAKDAFSYVEKKVAALLGYCINDAACGAYKSLREDNGALDEIRTIAMKRVKGTMCGDSAWGLTTHYSIMLSGLSKIVGFGEYSDGMVAVSSCTLPGLKMEKQPHDLHYVSALNHADGTCRNSNGWIRAGRPCDYFTDKV
jgi:hypothetical protein